MERLLNQMKTKFVDKDVPVILGEFGANWRNISSKPGESQEKHNASIRLHYYTLTKLALERGMVPMMWDTNYCGRPSMTIINRANRSIYNSYMMDGINQALSEMGQDIPCIQELPADGEVYDLQGRRLDAEGHEPQGLFVREGRICLVK